MNLKSFFAELKRRNVYKVAVAYAVVSWLLIQAASILFPTFEAPPWVMKVFVAVIVLGFPIALVFSWAFEATPEGIKREKEAPATGSNPRTSWRRFIILILTIGAVAAFLLGWQMWRARNAAPATNAAAATETKSIAVLPFESLSEDKSNAYFADGIQDEILARLSKIADLKVISRTSTEKYKSAPANLREIAQQLGVANILEGSVQKAGKQVRITVQLINALKDDHLWADTYDRNVTDIFGVESDVAQKIASSLAATLTGREKKEIAFVGTTNPEAYDAYLRALALRGAQSNEGAEKQETFLRRAVQLDPNYAQAWALLAQTAALAYFNDPIEAEKESAREAVETALRLAPELADSRMAKGIFDYYCLNDFDSAITELKAAQESAPNNGGVAYFLALVQRRQGKVEESLRGMEQAAALDPLNEDIPVNMGRSYRGLRKFEEARAMFDRALALAPNDANILSLKAETYLAQGDVETAWKMVTELKHAPGEEGFQPYMFVLLIRRQYDEMLAEIQPVLANEQAYPPVLRRVIHIGAATIYLFKGDRAAALPFVEKARRDQEEVRKEGGVGFAGFYIQMIAQFGDRAAAEKRIEELFAKTRNDKWQFPGSENVAAIAYVQLGDFDRALPLIQDALTQPTDQSLTTADLRQNPGWDPIRTDPRFQALLSK